LDPTLGVARRKKRDTCRKGFLGGGKCLGRHETDTKTTTIELGRQDRSVPPFGSASKTNVKNLRETWGDGSKLGGGGGVGTGRPYEKNLDGRQKKQTPGGGGSRTACGLADVTRHSLCSPVEANVISTMIKEGNERVNIEEGNASEQWKEMKEEKEKNQTGTKKCGTNEKKRSESPPSKKRKKSRHEPSGKKEGGGGTQQTRATWGKTFCRGKIGRGAARATLRTGEPPGCKVPLRIKGKKRVDHQERKPDYRGENQRK